MWHPGRLTLELCRHDKARAERARRRASLWEERRLRLEPLESRELLSADVRTMDPFPASHATDTSHAAALTADVVSSWWGRLYKIAWYGSGQVRMREQGNWWADDAWTDRGDRYTATGSSKPSWVDYNGDGDADEYADVWDPIAYKLNSKPKLKATFLVDRSIVKSLKVYAESVDGGASLQFNGSARIATSSPSIYLTTTDRVGGVIANRDVVLQWYVSVNGGDWENIGSTAHRLFVVYGAPLHTSTNAATAARVWYACHLAYDRSTRMAMADDIAQDAQGRFDSNYFYMKEDAWQVLDTGGDCGSCSWLMHNALAAIGVSSQVRYIYPQHYTWTGLYSTRTGRNEVRRGGGAYLMYIDANGNGNNYEGTCYVNFAGEKRYYLGGYGGDWKPSAYDVLMWVSWYEGALSHQCWSDDTGTVVSYPSGRPPAYLTEASVADADWRSLVLADGSFLPKRVDLATAAAISSTIVVDRERSAARPSDLGGVAWTRNQDYQALAAAFAAAGSHSHRKTHSTASSVDHLMASYGES